MGGGRTSSNAVNYACREKQGKMSERHHDMSRFAILLLALPFRSGYAEANPVIYAFNQVTNSLLEVAADRSTGSPECPQALPFVCRSLKKSITQEQHEEYHAQS